MSDHFTTALNYIRRTREYLQDNKPVMAHTMLEKVEQYVQLSSKAKAIDIDALHSSIDIDVEDTIGREISLEESKLVGIVLELLTQHGLLIKAQSK